MSRETATVLSAALICPNRGLSSTFQAVCASVRELGFAVEVNEYPVVREVERLLSEHRVEAVFIDVSADRRAALQVISAFARVAPEVAVAGLDEANNPEAILQCLRGGATEFLASPFPVE